jgi:hypothetical protein
MVQMKRSLVLLGSVAALAACTTKDSSKEQLKTLAHADSLRSDSLVAMKNELLNEVMASTQFISDINSSLARARALQSEKSLVTQAGGSEAELNKAKEERKLVVAKIAHLVARLDSVESRLDATRARARSLAKRDSSLLRQVAQYEKTLTEFRGQVERQRAEYQTIIDHQNSQITELSATNTQLVAVKEALSDTVGQMTNEKNTAYYVIGTKEELIKKGVLVEEGGKRFFVLGGRNIQPARSFDVSAFTRIDRTRDSVIALPAGEYRILTRQSSEFTAPFSAKEGKIAGGLKISQPERFWEASRFLILMRS